LKYHLPKPDPSAGALDWKHEPGKGVQITTPLQVLATIPEAERLGFIFRIETE
jgi:hypothetical protein